MCFKALRFCVFLFSLTRNSAFNDVFFLYAVLFGRSGVLLDPDTTVQRVSVCCVARQSASLTKLACRGNSELKVDDIV